MRTAPKRKLAHEIPTSSMADIAFLLVVYFMVTTTFAATRGLDFDVSEQHPDDINVVPEASVLVEVQRGGRLQVDGRPMELTNLLEYLRPKLEMNPDKPVIVKPKPDSEYGYMVTVLDELRQGQGDLGLDRPINIALPTEREARIYWQ